MGKPLSPQHKVKIREAQRRRFLALAVVAVEHPDRKPCAECGEVKPLDQFSPRKTRLKSGVISISPHSYCKNCAAARSKRNRERWQRRDPDRWKEMRKKQLAKEDPLRRRERQRETETARRRAEGAESRPREAKRTRPQVPTEPLAMFLDGRRESSTEIEKLSGIDERRIRDLKARTYPKTDLETVDKILLGLGCLDEFDRLYPLDEKFYGYKIEDPDGLLEKYRDAT